MLVATFVITLTLGIETGIISGMVLSLLVISYRASIPHIAQLGRVPGTNTFRNITRFKNMEVRDDLLMVRIDGPIYFANVEFIKDKPDLWISEKGRNLKMLIFNMESVSNIDLKKGQQPKVLLLGCSDSRVSPSMVLCSDLGELFIHRNIANILSHTDLNFLLVMHYAVEVLGVRISLYMVNMAAAG